MGLRVLLLFSAWLGPSAQAAEDLPVRLYSGFLTKVRCEGRLLVSAIGSEAVVRLEALPKEVGCGVVLKPLQGRGETNLLLETTTGTIQMLLRIESGSPPRSEELDVTLRVSGRSQ